MATNTDIVVSTAPLEGYAMAPPKSWVSLVSSTVCGHDIIQALTEDQQREFEQFVREVLRTT